ncbi:MAG: hypothetical protein IPN71_04395 [Fibrobacteres bacterium]|nr:hypothetical protein [Fibrobacterota bacterium]
METLLCEVPGVEAGISDPAGAHPLCYSMAWFAADGGRLLSLGRILPRKRLEESSAGSYLPRLDAGLMEDFQQGLARAWSEGCDPQDLEGVAAHQLGRPRSRPVGSRPFLQAGTVGQDGLRTRTWTDPTSISTASPIAGICAGRIGIHGAGLLVQPLPRTRRAFLETRSAGGPMTEFAHSTTQSVCPECRQKVSARIVERQGEVFLDKWCATHGESSVLVSSDASWYRESVHHVKPRQVPLALQVENFQGCPESCGFCTEHRQHTCLPVIEILRDCDLRCPVCLKGEANDERMDLATFEKVLDTLLAAEGSLPVVNLSGASPRCIPRSPSSARRAPKGRGAGDGLHQRVAPLGRPDAAGCLCRKRRPGGSPVRFNARRGQPDPSREGDVPAAHGLARDPGKRSHPVFLRGHHRPGVNEDQIADLAELLFTSKASTLMLQPVSLAGRAAEWDTSRRLTIPDVVAGLAKNQRLKREDFHPLPCSHPSCFAMSYFVETDDGIWKTLKPSWVARDS